MCTPSDHIKLCTCDDVEKGSSKTWCLHSSEHLMLPVGDFVFSDENFREFNVNGYLESKILDDLNNVQVFDFDYSPSKNDVLTIYLNRRVFTYVFIGITWISVKADQVDEPDNITSGGKVALS